MNNIKKIGLLLVVLVVIAGFTQAAKEEKPNATLRLSGKSVAAGIGFSWGKGTLTYRGKDYPVSVKGLALVKVGITKVTASGKVYNLKKLHDFDGNYTAAGAGMTLAGGGSAIAMKNQNGVRVVLGATTRGVDVTIGGAGVDMAIKK
jgi:DMSO reductase anchor subunit